MVVGWTVCVHNCSPTPHNLLAHTAPLKPGLTETQNFFASVQPVYSRAFVPDDTEPGVTPGWHSSSHLATRGPGWVITNAIITVLVAGAPISLWDT